MSEVEFPPHVEPVLKELARRIELSQHTPKAQIKINTDSSLFIKPGYINGALLGGTTLMSFQIVRGFPVEVIYRLQAKDVIPYTYTSGNIVDYGIIPT